MKLNNLDQDELNKEMILDLFYKAGGRLDEINRALDTKLLAIGVRKITLFEEFIKSRLLLNPLVLRMTQMEVTPLEAIYLSRYPALQGLQTLDLRKNHIGDEGLEAIAQSPLFTDLRELDLRNNGITRLGMKILAESDVLGQLKKLDLRTNKLGKRWEEKLKEAGKFPNFTELKVA